MLLFNQGGGIEKGNSAMKGKIFYCFTYWELGIFFDSATVFFFLFRSSFSSFFSFVRSFVFFIAHHFVCAFHFIHQLKFIDWIKTFQFVLILWSNCRYFLVDFYDHCCHFEDNGNGFSAKCVFGQRNRK